jgi:hypothetical protein
VNRLSAKIFFEEDSTFDSAAFVVLFHRIIQDDLLPDEKLIDVVSYRHVHQGPWVQLVCTEGQYVLDGRDGRPGLKYIARDHQVGINEAIKKIAALALIAERELGVRFRTDEAELELFERRKYPNSRDGYLRATASIAAEIGAVFDHAELSWAGAADLLGVMRLGLHTERRSTLGEMIGKVA